MTLAVVFQGVRAIDPACSLDAIVDVVVEGGRITRVGRDAGHSIAGADRVTTILGGGRWLLPAFVDLHAHLREPGEEHKEDIRTGLAAAAAGGFAHVCVMPNTKPVNDHRAITELMVAKAKSVGGARLYPIGAITRGQAGKALTEMADLRDAGAVAVSDDGHCVTSSSVMRRALEYAKTFDLPVIQHAEDHELTEGALMHEGRVSTDLGLRGWPRVAEDIIVARDVILAEYTSARYHLAHASTIGSARILREAKSRGLKVTAEVTPHHLLLTDASVIGYDTACRVNPPLREDEDIEALREALADGTIDCIATDHAPHSHLEKDCEFSLASPGMVGLELCFPLLAELAASGEVPLERIVMALTSAPARIIGIEPPTIREGASADLVLYAPEERWTIAPERLRSKSSNTPFLGRDVVGQIALTMVAGAIAFDAGLSAEGAH